MGGHVLEAGESAGCVEAIANGSIRVSVRLYKHIFAGPGELFERSQDRGVQRDRAGLAVLRIGGLHCHGPARRIYVPPPQRFSVKAFIRVVPAIATAQPKERATSKPKKVKHSSPRK